MNSLYSNIIAGSNSAAWYCTQSIRGWRRKLGSKLFSSPRMREGRRLCLPHALHKRDAHQHLAAVLSSACLDLSFIKEKGKTVRTGGINNGCMKVNSGWLTAATLCCTEVIQ